MRLVSKYETATSRGMLSKAWYTDGKDEFLVKGNSTLKGATGYEPYSEVMACRIANILGLPCVQYTLGNKKDYSNVKTYNCGVVSICRKIKIDEGQQMVSACGFFETVLNKNIDDYWVAYHKIKIDKIPLYRMLVFDAIIGNNDRHLKNWELILDGAGIKHAPVIDNGASLLAWTNDIDINKKFVIGNDKCKPFKESHTRQIAMVKRYCTEPLFNINTRDMDELYLRIMSSISDILVLLPKNRSNAIAKYIKNRLFFFLPYFIIKENI